MGEDKPQNPLDEFWDTLGDKKKKYVRSYGSNKRNIQTKKSHATTDGQSNPDHRKRRG